MLNPLNLQEINSEQALNLSRFFLKTGQNIAFFGQSGIGKSNIAFDTIQEMKLKVSYLNLSLLDRGDFGMANMFAPGDLLSFKHPHYLPKLKEGEVSDRVLLLDEVDKAEHEITAPLLEILQFRTVNGIKINCAAVILTGNLPEEHTFSNEISSALLGRCAKYKLIFDFEKWLIWARANGVHDLILGFLQANPQYACSPLDTAGQYAAPSPRGWTLASSALIAARQIKLLDVETITNIISGFVGYSIGLQFKTWYSHFRQFEPAILSILETGSCSIDYAELTPIEKMVFVITACNLAKLRFIAESKKKPQYQSVERLCAFLEKNASLENMAIGLSNSFPIEMVAAPQYRLYNCKRFFELSSRISLPFKK